MKFILMLLILTILPHSFAGSKKGYEKKQVAQDYQCKQKSLPLKISYLEKPGMIDLYVHFEQDLKKFQVLSVKGIDGVDVLSSVSDTAHDFLKLSNKNFQVKYKKSPGLGYVVFELKALFNGSSKVQMISIPVGEMTAAQKQQKSKNITTSQGEKSPLGAGSKNPRPRKEHRLKFE